MTASLSAIDPATQHGLRVVFEKTQDRWSHFIERVAGEETSRVIETVEGDAEAMWPASPPFQELNRGTLPDGRDVLFLVGKAGGSHWSASVEAALDPPRIVFDIACRHSAAPDRLTSEYRPLAPGWSIEGLDGLGRVMPIGATLVAIPAAIASEFPATTRWKYQIAFSEIEIRDDENR